MATSTGTTTRSLGLLLSARSVKTTVGLTILTVFLGFALCGTALLTHDPTDFVAAPHEAPSTSFWLGTTGQGQDVLAQTIAGARLSLLVGFGVGLAVVAISAVVGTAAGYFGGWVDELLSIVINLFLIMPGLPLAVVIAAYLPAGPATICFVLILTGWAWNARVMRAQALSLREKDFVLAAKVAGESHFRIITRELLPNMRSLMVSGFIGATVYAIGAQVGLEFLGLGDVSVVTWGTNLYWASNNAALLTGAWWTIVPTGVSVALVGFSLALLNSAIDDVANPRLRAESDLTRIVEASGGSLTRGVTPVLRTRALAPRTIGEDSP
jgi:peptide/nickel transport system permease protein